MKIKITVPDGKYCSSDDIPDCSILQHSNGTYFCKPFKRLLDTHGSYYTSVLKCDECLDSEIKGE